MGVRQAVALFAALLGAVAQQDVGFESLFKSQLDDFSNFCIKTPARIPSWAFGDFIIPSVGKFEMGDRRFVGFLDAFGKMHRFELREGEICATYRLMATKFFNDSKKENTITAGLLFFETEPPRHCPWYDPVCNLLAPGDNTFVNTIKHGGKLLSMTDSPFLLEIDPESMSVTGPFKFADKLQGKICYSSSAHPVRHPRTGDWIDFIGNANLISGATVRLFHLSESDPYNRRSVADIPMEFPSYMHSFGVTEKHIVLPFMPVKLDVKDVAIKTLVQAFKEVDPLEATRVNAFHLVPHDGGAVKLRKLPAEQRLYFTHTVNTYENDTGVVIDLCTFPQNFFTMNLTMAFIMDKAARDGHGEPRPVVKRFLLPFAEDSPVTSEVISDPRTWTDFTKINPRYQGQKHCFYWALQWFTDGKAYATAAISKYDLCTGAPKRQWHRPNWYTAEASFVPSPEEGAAEDEGVLMFTALDGVKEETYFVVINASTMETIAATGPFPRIGATTHSEFYPAQSTAGLTAATSVSVVV